MTTVAASEHSLGDLPSAPIRLPVKLFEVVVPGVPELLIIPIPGAG